MISNKVLFVPSVKKAIKCVLVQKKGKIQDMYGCIFFVLFSKENRSKRI